MEEYSELLEELEELESIRAYDAAKASGEKPIPFEAAVGEIEGRRRTDERAAVAGGGVG